MKKADNFDATKWLTENKITRQSRLNENEVPVPKTLTPSAKKKVDDLIARAEVANKNKDAEELEKIYYEALKINPRSAFGYFMKVLRNKGIAKKGYLGFVWSFEDPARLNMKPPTSRYDDDSLNEDSKNPDIKSFLKQNRKEVVDAMIKMDDYDEEYDIETLNALRNEPIDYSANEEGDMDKEIAGFGEIGLDFSFNPKKVKDSYGEANNFTIKVAGKTLYGISYNI